MTFSEIFSSLRENRVHGNTRGWPPALFLLSADISTVICDTPQKALVLIGNVEKGLTPGLKLVILMDPFEEDLKKRGEKCGVEILSLFDAEVGTWSSTAKQKAGLIPWAACRASIQESKLMSSRGGGGAVNYIYTIQLWESFPQDNSESLPVGEEGLWPADRLPSREFINTEVVREVILEPGFLAPSSSSVSISYVAWGQLHQIFLSPFVMWRWNHPNFTEEI